MLKARILHRPESSSFDVFIFEELEGEKRIPRVMDSVRGDEQPRLVDYEALDRHEKLPVSFSLTEAELHALRSGQQLDGPMSPTSSY